MKTCQKCNAEKPAQQFYRNANKPDGLCSYCKECENKRKAAYNAANKEKVKAYGAAYHANNKEKNNSRNAEWRARNKEKISQRMAVYAAENKDRIRIKDANWKAKNPEKVKRNLSAWREANPEKVKAHKAAFHAAHPEQSKIRGQNRRARKHENGGKLSPGLHAKLFKLQRGKCACCHVSLADGNHLDHVIPLALEGPNEDWNMQLLCPPCNLSKNAKHPVDFMQSRGFLL